MNLTLKRLCIEANKVKDITSTGSSNGIEYYSADGNNITVTVEKSTRGPLSKKFECTCEHASLFGNKENIPCKHIFALINWLVTNNKGNKQKVVCVSGYFNPLHVGHLRMMQEAKKLGDKLVVIVNSDEQVKLKGSVPFMSQEDRVEIIKGLACVDDVFLSIDKDKTVCESLKKVDPDIFANGGDRKSDNVPELEICKKQNIEMVWEVGGGKIRASSEMIKKAGEQK